MEKQLMTGTLAMRVLEGPELSTFPGTLRAAAAAAAAACRAASSRAAQGAP